MVESCRAGRPTSANDPALVCILSPVSTLSLSSTGIPWRGPSTLPVAAQLVRVFCHLKRVWVELNDLVARLGTLVQRLDASQVFVGQIYVGEPAAGHLRLELRDGRFDMTRGNSFLPVRSYCGNVP